MIEFDRMLNKIYLYMYKNIYKITFLLCNIITDN